jgi:hypothetical protein
MLSLEVGVFAIERRGASDHLNDDRARLLSESFRDDSRSFVGGPAELDLHELSRTQRVVQRAHERRRDALSTNMHERIEMVRFRAKLGPLLSGDRHTIFVGIVRAAR